MNTLKILFLISAIALFGCDEKDPPEKEVIKKTELSNQLEYKVAIIDAGIELPEQDFTISHTRKILEVAELTFGVKKERIADMAAKTQQIAKDKNLDVKIIEIIEAALIICDANCNEDNFIDYVSNYIMARSVSGQNHYQAIHGIVVLNNFSKIIERNK